ncbi:hypothetical protein HMI55_002635 [Coelomomyces lativittatus]|nr:hypothetical protein HMI55_002635 [Coelomomyces lativittatus]
MAVLLLLLSPFIFFICILPRSRRKKLSLRNFKYELSSRAKLIWLCIFFLLFVLEIIVVICAVVGNFTLSIGISNTFSSVVTALQNVVVFLGNLKPTVINFFNSASQFGNGTITNLTSISTLPDFILESKLIASQLSNSLLDISKSLSYITTNATLLNVTFQYLTSNVTFLNKEIQWALGNTTALNNLLTVPGSGEVYQLNQPISNIPNAPSLPSFSSSALSDLSSILLTLDTLPDFRTLATALNTQSSNIENTITSQLISSRRQFQSELTTILHNSNMSLLGVIDDANFVKTTENLISTLSNDLQSITPEVQKFEGGRYYFHLTFEILCILSFFVIGLALASRSKKPVTCCSCSSLLFAILYFFFTGLYFSLALLWSETCQQLDPNTPMLTVSAIMGDTAPTKYAKVAISTANYCKQNYSLFEALEKSNFTSIFQGVQTLNFSTLAMSALNGLNFTKLVENALDFQLNQYFSVDINLLSLQMAYVNQLDFNSAILESWSLNSTLFQPLITLSSALSVLSNSIVPASFTYGQLYSSERQLNAVYDFKGKINRIQNLLTETNQTAELCSQEIWQLGQYAKDIRTSMEQLQVPIRLIIPRYNDLKSTVDSYILQTKDDFVQSKIPFAINSISKFVQSAQAEIGQELSCYPIGLSYYSLLNGFCVTLLGGIDAIWFAFFIHALFALLAISNFRFLREIIVQNTPGKGSSKTRIQQEDTLAKSIKASAIDDV